jgi:hypothetical protein
MIQLSQDRTIVDRSAESRANSLFPFHRLCVTLSLSNQEPPGVPSGTELSVGQCKNSPELLGFYATLKHHQ